MSIAAVSPEHEQERQLVAANLRRLRARRGLTQRQLALLAEMSQNHLSEYETGKHAPRGPNRKRLADALGVEPWQLLVPPGAGS